MRSPNLIEETYGIEVGQFRSGPPQQSRFAWYYFEALRQIGGYGTLSAGMYNTRMGGYKPYGALGQGPADNLNVYYPELAQVY